MDEEGNTRRSDFEEDALNAMRPERPDFTRSAMGGEDGDEAGEGGFYRPNKKNDADDKKKLTRRYAASDLGNAERGAVGMEGSSQDRKMGGINEAKDKESNPATGFYNKMQSGAGGFWKGGRGLKGKLTPQKGKKNGFVKYGAFTTLFVFLMLGVFVSTSTMSTQLNAWKENIYAMFGQNSAVMNKRSNFLMNTFLSTNKGITKTTFLGKARFSIGKKMAANLEKEGIYTVDEDVNGKKTKILVYVDEDGRATPIVADGRDIDGAKGLVGKEYDLGGNKVVLSESPMVLSVAEAEYEAFSKAKSRATLTVTGRMAGWFSQVGEVPERLLKRIIGDDARHQMSDLNDDSTKEDVERKVTEPSKMQDGDFDARERKSDDEDDGGDEGDDGSGSDADTDADEAEKDRIRNEDSKMTGGDVSAVSTKLKAKAEKAAAYGGAGSLICGFLKAMGSISSTVGAIQTANAIDFTSKYLEVADGIKAQEANNSVNLANELLNEPRESEIYDTSQYDADGNPLRVDEGKKVATTASVGFNAAFSQDDIIDENAPVTKMVNRENTLSVALANLKNSPIGVFAPLLEFGSIGSGLEVTSFCNGLKVVTSFAGLVADFAAVFAPGSGVIKQLIENVMDVSKVQVIMAAAGFVIGLIAPIVTQFVGSTLAKVAFGEVGGMMLWTGAQALMNSNLQMSTGLLPDAKGAKEVFALTKEVEREEWAPQDRLALSPFDTSSKYTFLGSIVNSLAPIMNQSGNGVVSTVSSVAKLTGESALALTSSTASAADEVYQYELSLASEDNCYRLHSVGAEGTETCHKYNGASVQDLDTIDADDVLVKISELDDPLNPSFDGTYDDGNPKINTNSDLAKYIVACVMNDSQPGDVDASVQGFMQKAQSAMETGNALADSLIDFGVGLVPFSDVPDLMAGIEEQKNMRWNSKEACTGRTNDENLNQKVRYYSTYTLDQRVMEEMGAIDTNAVMAFMDDYYEENPLDQSYEGRIARFSGQTKEEVETNLAYLDYMVALYEYDPSEKYAFGEPEVKIDQPLRLDHQTEVQVADTREKVANELVQIVYADVRNRVTVS